MVPLVHLCMYCLKVIDLGGAEELIEVEKEWENKPAKYAHLKCHRGHLERTEPRGTRPGPNVDIRQASYGQGDED